MKKSHNTLLFDYDVKGSPAILRLNGTPYTYVKNVQGDIVGLIDNAGALVVEYKYDTWGNPTATRTLTTAYDALAELNPFRYRGYVWDEEILYYYLYSRYYYISSMRFINADTKLGRYNSINTHNMYAYTRNNPILRIDKNGLSDVIYTEYNKYTVENDTGAHTFMYGVNYYVEIDGKRYPANSQETVTLREWSSLNITYFEKDFHNTIAAASQYASFSSVLNESIGGELDFKNKLNKNELYLFDGVVYNTNEAGNFMWSYFLKESGYNDIVGDILANGGSLVNDIRLDEPHDIKAREAGLFYWYKYNNLIWWYHLQHGPRKK